MDSFWDNVLENIKLFMSSVKIALWAYSSGQCASPTEARSNMQSHSGLLISHLKHHIHADSQYRAESDLRSSGHVFSFKEAIRNAC